MGYVCRQLVAVVFHHRIRRLAYHLRYSKRAEERRMKLFYGLLLLICCLLVIPPVSAGVAQLTWTKTIGQCVTAIDTNPTGTLILVGLGNGSIFAYDNTGNISWTNSTNTTSTNRAIKKIVADSAGNIAWISQANETGYIAFSGTVGGIVKGTGRNITDVAILQDGTRYATTELNPPRVAIRYLNGTMEIQNTTYGTATYWTKIGYDPYGTWMVTANQSNNILYFWNLSAWSGWEEFNPTHTVKNTSQIFLDTFPYRQNISVAGSGSIGLTFHSTTNTTYILQLNASYFEYNPANTGSYFYWTRSGYLNETQTGIVNLSWIDTITNSNYYVVLQPGYTNYTIYYGNTGYTNSIITAATSVTQNYTSGATWTAPIRVYSGRDLFLGVTKVNSVFLVGGGGTGGRGAQTIYSGWGTGGGGGSAGQQVTYNTITVTPGTGYPIVVGGDYSDSTGFGYTATKGAKGGDGSDTGGENCGHPPAYGGPGAYGYRLTGEPTAGTGQSVYNCPGSGGAGGVGYGAGGGGGGAGTQNGGWIAGGSGSSGIVSVIYELIVYYLGTTPTTTHFFTQQSQLTAVAMNQSSSKVYVGTILGISVPATGGLASIITDTIFYQQYISSGGIGLTYCATLSSGAPALFAGTPYAISTSNSGAASMEGRGAYANIYDAGGVARASSLTGGTVRSVDVAMTSGLFGVFGGDEGKVYMLSREGSSSWYSYFTGSADTQILAVATTWTGDAVIVGRFGGTLEYYTTNVTIPVTPTPAPNVDATIYAFKDSAPYTNQPITIYSSPLEPTAWVPVGVLTTDTSGKIAYSATAGSYYKFVVNNVVGTESGEGEVIWQSSASTPTAYIYITSPSTPYEWNAYYVVATHNVTVVYTDTIIPINITVSIKDLKTNLVVLSRSYTLDPDFTLEYHDVSGTGSYQVNIIINRLGMTVRDQRIVTSPDTYGITFPVDKYIVWAISTLVLMLMAGMFSYSNSKRGALAVVAVAVMMMYFGMLPWSMVTVASLAAMMAVMSLFASRVQ